jgi:hypothetical protein
MNSAAQLRQGGKKGPKKPNNRIKLRNEIRHNKEQEERKKYRERTEHEEALFDLYKGGPIRYASPTGTTYSTKMGF